MKRKLSIALLTVLCVSFTLFAFTACGGSGDDILVGEGMQKYVLEAEYTPVAGKIGGAQSGSASGYDLIMQSSAESVSNGYFIHNIHMADCTLEFNFKSERAGTTAIYVRLISQWGDTIFTPSNFGVVLNGKEINYSSMSVKGSTDDDPAFVDKIVTQNAEVKAGDNKLELIVRENTLNTYTNSTGGPAIDCVTLVTDTGISWVPLTENLDHVGQIEG